MAHLVLSSDDCSRYCSLPLSSPRYDYQIGSCRNDLQPGPFDLCRLSARMAKRIIRRGTHKVLGSKSTLGAGGVFRKWQMLPAQRQSTERLRLIFFGLACKVTDQKRRKSGRYTTHPRVAFLFKQLSLLSSFTSLVKHPCPTSWKMNMRRMTMLSC